MLKPMLFILTLLFFSITALCQQIDSIAFHLYTDSLKKGQHNYINVDGKVSDGHWLPLSAKEIQLSSSIGRFEGNDLILPIDTNADTVNIKAILRTNSQMQKKITIWIKKLPDPSSLPSKEEILKTNNKNKHKGFNLQ
jgi:hypothetical protein